MSAPSSLARYRTAARSVAGVTAIAGAALAGMLATPEALLAQHGGRAAAHPVASQAPLASNPGFNRNSELPEPRGTGRPAVGATVNLTINTLTWVDHDGSPTSAPRWAEAARLLEHGPLRVRGSLDERQNVAQPFARQAALAEPMRFFLTPSDAATLAQARQIVGQRLGLALSQGQVTEASAEAGRRERVYATGEAGRPEVTPAEGSAEAQIEADRRARRDEARRQQGAMATQAQNMPGQIARETAQETMNNVYWGVRSKVSTKVNNTIGRIMNRF